MFNTELSNNLEKVCEIKRKLYKSTTFLTPIDFKNIYDIMKEIIQGNKHLQKGNIICNSDTKISN